MANQVADIKEQINWHWRNTMRPVRFLGFDVKAIIPFFFLLFHISYGTLIFCVVVTLFFYLLEKSGLTFDAAMRATRVLMFGNKRYGQMKPYYRRRKDYGR